MEPSPLELLRRIEELTRSLERVTNTLESSYVRKDVYEARHDALRREIRQEQAEIRGDVSELQDAQKAQVAFRRQVLAGVLVGLVLILAQIVLVLTRIPGGSS